MTGRIVGGRYEVVREIARGGMGSVHEAVHLVSKKVVALKILFPQVAKDEASRQRFLREASAPAQIGHEGIVEVYDAGVDPQDGSLFVAMELLKGRTMRDYLAEGPKPLPEVLSLFAKVLEPLSAAHARGIVHRDLKPENVFLKRRSDGTDQVKILDFGIARDLEQQSQSLTSTGVAMGTPHYMAPEQAMSARGVVATADVWAIGAMLYEALTGRVPFDGETSSAVIVHVCTRPHAPIQQAAPQTPPALAALVDRCLSKQPEQRPHDAAVLAQELAHVQVSLFGSNAVVGPWSSSPSPTSIPGTSAPQPGFVAPPSQPGFVAPPAPQAYPTPGPAAGFGNAPSGPGAYPTPGPSMGFGNAPSQPGWAPPVPGAPMPGMGGMPPMGAPPYPTPGAGPGFGGPAAAPKKGLSTGALVGILASGLIVLVAVGCGLFAYFTKDDETSTVATAATTQPTTSGDANAGTPVAGPSNAPSPTTNGTTPPPAADGSRFEGLLEPGDRTLQSGEFADSYDLALTTGRTSVVRARSTEFDAYLIVRTPGGKQLDNDDDPQGGTDAVVEIPAEEAGTYTAIVTSSASGEKGHYELTVETR